jgi:hypothetical protein
VSQSTELDNQRRAEQPQAPSSAAPVNVAARFFALIWLLTLLSQLAQLQFRAAIFGGTGWLSDVKFVRWDERLGFVLILAVFCIASSGIWLLLWARLLRSLRVSPTAALSAASAVWIGVLALDFAIRQKLVELFGEAFDFLTFTEGAGGFGRVLENVWSWYGEQIVLSLLALMALCVGLFFAFRALRSQRWRWGWVERLSARGVRWIVASCSAVALLYLTVFSQTWPSTRMLLVDDTLVAMPFGRLVIALSDFDGDGYSQFDSPPDEAPFDDSRYPYALELPDDGVDQNFVGGDLQLDKVPPRTRQQVEQMRLPKDVHFAQRRNVLVVILESMRYDALGARLDARSVTPRLDALKQQGALQPEHFYAGKGFTNASLSELFWGSKVDPGHDLLDDFISNGYRTAFFAADDMQREGFESMLRLERAEELFDARSMGELVRRSGAVPAPLLAERVAAWIHEAARDERPFFLYVYFQDTHFPYNQDNPPVFIDEALKRSEISRDDRAQLWRAYLEQVHHVDAACGALIDALDAAGIRENSTVLFLGDHGESLFDDGLLLGHGIAILEVMLRTVLFVDGATGAVPNTLSHWQLRGLLREQLSAPEPGVARVEQRPDEEVFFYLGSWNTPTQIGRFSQADGWLAYDFARQRIHVPGTQTQQSWGEGEPELERQALDLVWSWEYLRNEE